MILGYRDRRTRLFAAGRRVPAFSGIERAAPLKLDRLEAAVSVGDLAVLPGNRFEALSGDRKVPVQHSDQRPMADLLRVAVGFARTDRIRNRRLPLRMERQMARPAIHPGEQLAEELRALDMSAARLARQLGVPTNRVTAILDGQRAITGDTALRLAHFFGTSPQFWLNLQALYDLRLAEKKAPKRSRRCPD